jgi:hypothetical protein
MPHKWYAGKTGVVWNVTKRAVGVEVNKIVGGSGFLAIAPRRSSRLPPSSALPLPLRPAHRILACRPPSGRQRRCQARAPRRSIDAQAPRQAAGRHAAPRAAQEAQLQLRCIPEPPSAQPGP